MTEEERQLWELATGHEIQRWRALALVPVGQQLLVAVALSAVARTSLGLVRWYGAPGGDAGEPPPDLSVRGQAITSDNPDGQTERVQYFDPVRRVSPQSEPPGFSAGVYCLELVRVRVPGQAVAVLERIATWLRVTSTTAGGPGTTVEYFEGSSLAPKVTNGSPFAFPIVDGAGGTFQPEWVVIRQRIGDTGDEPEFVQLGAANLIPADVALVGPWNDGRYTWGSQYSGGLYWLTGARSILRFFLTVTITGAGFWTFEAAGRLGGFIQINGKLGASLDTATTRRH